MERLSALARNRSHGRDGGGKRLPERRLSKHAAHITDWKIPHASFEYRIVHKNVCFAAPSLIDVKQYWFKPDEKAFILFFSHHLEVVSYFPC